MPMGQVMPGPSIRNAYYIDPVSGQMKDLLQGQATTQAGIPGLMQQADANVYGDTNREIQGLYNPKTRSFARPPKNDTEAAAMNAFIERQQAEDADRQRNEHRQRTSKILGLIGLGGMNSGGGFA